MSRYITEGKIRCKKDMNLTGIPNAFKEGKLYTYKETKREKIIQNLNHPSKYCTMLYKDAKTAMERFDDHFEPVEDRRKKFIDDLLKK